MNQIELHNRIKILLSKSPDDVRKEEVLSLISDNGDAYLYFFAEADERWIDWLWENEFFDTLKGKLESPDQYGQRRPELNYLSKVSKKDPASVTKIMFEVPVSTDSFNPEVIDRFLRICSELPEKELVKMLPKIYKEKWVQLMNTFNDWGFEYERMLQTLEKTSNYEGTLIVARILLSVRNKREAEESSQLSPDNPFYFKDLSYTKIFEYLLKIDDKHLEEALTIVIDTMKQAVFFRGVKAKDSPFKVYDSFFSSLLDMDLFTLEVGEKNGISHVDDIKNLMAVIKQFTIRIIGENCAEASLITKVYNTHFRSLPDSRSMWRLRLFVLSLCPEAFKDKLKEAFFRLFDVERYHELISGTEYQKALRVGFPVLSEADKRDYIKRVIDYFIKKDQEKENEKENWHIRYGSRILSVITDQLTNKEKKIAKEAKFILKPDYEPEPSIGKMRSGTVVSRGPITQEEFGNLSISEIAKKLRKEWIPGKLSKQNKADDFLSPLNAEGVSELLRIDISKRPQDYIINSNLFFEQDVLDQHYTYSFLRGIQEILRDNKVDISDINWDNLIAFCVAIKGSGEVKPFDLGKREHGSFDAWLTGWTGVHSAITDVIQELLKERGGKIAINFSKYRDDLLAIINYLLSYQDPVPKDEEDKDGLLIDPFSTAINTVRGRAFEALTLFVYEDSKKFSKDKAVKINSDIKKIYKSVLENENTRALMFMFGHYLPSFYYRDKKWIKRLLPQIFPREIEKKHLYTASWEGYLSSSLYKEIFFDSYIQELYKYSLDLTDAEHSKQKHFKEPNEGIAIHIALAFMHFSKFGFKHSLFKKFWETKNVKRHKEFISFIGRYSISRKSAVEWMKYNKVDIKKLKKFWDWALENCSADALIGFGFWINVEHRALDVKWLAQHTRQTIEKTNGYLERDYGLERSLMVFAKEAPEDTLAILRAYLFEEVAKHEPTRTWPHMDKEVFDAFKELYGNKEMREDIKALINDLLPYRSGLFWGLKSVLDESSS